MLKKLKALCFFQIVALGIVFAFEAVQMKDRGISEGTIGWVLGFGNLLVIFTSNLWGYIADRFNAFKQLIIIGMLGISFSLFLFYRAEVVLDFIVYIIFRASFLPMVLATMPTLALHQIKSENKGREFGKYRAFGSLGFITGTMILPRICSDIPTSCLLASILLLFSIFIAVKLENPPIIQNANKKQFQWKHFPACIWSFALIYLLISTLDPAIFAFYAAYCRSIGATTNQIAYLFGTMGILALISLPVAGKIIDKFGAEKVIFIAFLAQSLRILGYTQVQTTSSIFYPQVTHGIAWAGLEIAMTIYVTSKTLPHQRASVLALFFSLKMFATTLSAPLTGQLVEQFSYNTMFWFYSVIAIITTSLLCIHFYYFREGKTFLKKIPETTARQNL